MRAYLYNFVIFALDLPGLKAEDLEDVIKQAATLNVARQLNKYEVRVFWISGMDRVQNSLYSLILGDVLKQAPTLNDARQLNKYEVRVFWIAGMDRIQNSMAGRISGFCT